MVKEVADRLYNKSYRYLLLIPAAMLLFGFIFIFMFYQSHGDVLNKDVSLTGGTTVTVFDAHASIDQVKASLTKQFPDITVRGLSDIGTGGQRGFTIETGAGVDQIKPALEKELGYALTNSNSSIEFSQAALSQGFYIQLLNSIIAAFFLMAWVVFIIFSSSIIRKALATMLTFFSVSISMIDISWMKTFAFVAIVVAYFIILFNKQTNVKNKWSYLGLVLALILLLIFAPLEVFVPIMGAALIFIYITSSIPSFAVILSAFADIFLTLVVVDLMGMRISGAGIVAFLMLIGYSVDTDILLTSRLLRNKNGSVNERIWGAFKTGITMTLTAIAAVGVSLVVIYGLSETLRQIFTILLIGLIFDIFNTWLTNASMLKWYMGAKKLE